MGDELGLDYMLSTSTNIQPQRPPAWRMLIVDGHSLQYALDHWIIPYALDVTLSILDMAFCHYTFFHCPLFSFPPTSGIRKRSKPIPFVPVVSPQSFSVVK